MKKILFSLLMLCCMTAAVAQPWPPKVYEVGTLEELEKVISHRMADSKCIADIKLTADIYMSDLGEGESGRHTLCSTFSGTLDGNGHTIWAARPEVQHDGGGHYHRQYLFTYCNGATIKNLTFKDFRVQSEDNYNQAIITSQAKNKCLFDNITLDHVSVFCNKDNVGAVTGYTEDCTFTNITVKNSDFTTDMTQSGAVVGHAKNNCTFTNIKVENCESTSDDGKSGGVAGRTDGGTINNVEIHGTFIKTNSSYGGGVVGYSERTRFKDCIVDDQSCVCVDGCDFPTNGHAGDAGGIVGYGESCVIRDCVNSALITADERDAGGIVGYSNSSNIVSCLNTGMVISIGMNEVKESFYNKYKTKTGMTYVTKTYQGKEYAIRKYEGDYKSDSYFGGIVGWADGGMVIRCANFGSVYGGGSCIGGIVGYVIGGTISDCLSDFSGDEDSFGICEFQSCNVAGSKYQEDSYTIYEVHIDNCLNMSTYKDFDAWNDEWVGFSGGNNYSLTTATDAHLTKHITKTTVAKIESGEICALLGEYWEQNPGDPYPTPTVTVFSDNIEYNYNSYTTTGSVTIKRTFNDDGWYSLCLPFSLTAEQTEEKFAQVAEFSEIDGDTYKFTTVDVMEAGKAYIVKVDAKLENPKFTNVTIAANVKADESGAFVGVLKPTVIGDGCKVIGSGTTVNPANAGTMKAFRAYFPASSSANARYFSVDDSEITSVESIKEGTSDDAIYNMQGIRVAEAKRGLYIVNGKKVFVK